jgi:hypothetical protein
VEEGIEPGKNSLRDESKEDVLFDAPTAARDISGDTNVNKPDSVKRVAKGIFNLAVRGDNTCRLLIYCSLVSDELESESAADSTNNCEFRIYCVTANEERGRKVEPEQP